MGRGTRNQGKKAVSSAPNLREQKRKLPSRRETLTQIAKSLGGELNQLEHIKLPDGEVILGVYEEEEEIRMPGIKVSPQGQGLGKKAMEAVKNYAEQRKKPLTISLVQEPRYFDQFDWLTVDEWG